MELLRRRWPDLGLVLAALAVLGTSLTSGLPHVPVAGSLEAAALLGLLLRRRLSVLAAVPAFALTGVALLLAAHAPASMFLGVLLLFLVAGTLTTRRDAVTAWLAGVAVVSMTLLTSSATQGASDIALTLVFCTIVWAAGLAAAERGRQASAARAHAADVESHHEAAVGEAMRHERARIAGELHDIVSHGLSIVILQTVAARNALEDHPSVPDPDVDRRLRAVESTARSGLDDMRRLLDLLRPDVEPDDRAPAVGLAYLPALVDQAREAGQPVELRCDDVGPDLAPGLDAAAYRIVQEALTNALRHASGARTCVRVRRTGDELTLTVRTALVRPARSVSGAGFGLVGMRERARLYNGRLRAAPNDDGFEVEATFPVEPSA